MNFARSDLRRGARLNWSMRLAEIVFLSVVVAPATATATAYNSLTMKDGHVYTLQSGPNTEDQVLEFSQLSDSERENFFDYRNRTLETVANLLHKAPARVGFIVKAGNKLTRVSRSAWARLRPQKTDGAASPLVPTNESLTTELLSVDTIQATLNDFDSGLWNSLRILAKPFQQKGAVFTVQANTGAGIRKKGFFIGYQFGVGWGYDKGRQQKYVEYFYIRDHFQSAPTFILNLNAGVRFGYRTGPTNDGPNLQKSNRTGTGLILPLAMIYVSDRSLSAMSGPGVDLGWMAVGALKAVQLGTTEFNESGSRLYFSNLRDLVSQLFDLFENRKNEVILDVGRLSSARTCEMLFK